MMIELLAFHITVALSGIIVSSYSFFAPSIAKIRLAYALLGLTLASGTWLIIATHTPILSGCLSGLAYVTIVLIGLVPARYKLAKQTKSVN